jgi:TolA-binding protein
VPVLFYLGEINYKNSKFKDAISFYKKSTQYLKKTQYFTDDLLYHTGYAFEKLKNYDAAKKSYLKLIHDFPKSTLAKYAKKRLENLEKIK